MSPIPTRLDIDRKNLLEALYAQHQNRRSRIATDPTALWLSAAEAVARGQNLAPMSRAERLKRVIAIDIQTCPDCCGIKEKFFIIFSSNSSSLI